MIATLLFIAVFLSFTISPNILYLLGINYVSDQGSLVEKVHVTTIIAAGALLLNSLFFGITARTLRPSGIYFLFFSLLVTILCGVQASFPFSITIVTLGTPILILLLLEDTTAAFRELLRKMILILLLANSAVGIAEQITNITFLPRLAGTQVYVNDPRSVGILGHPLTASAITGLIILYLVVSDRSKALFSFSRLQVLLHLTALMFFGGRLAMVCTAIFVGIFILFDGKTDDGRRFGLLPRLGLTGALVSLATFVAFSPAGAAILARFENDSGSSQLRWEALSLLSNVSVQQLLFGLTEVQRETLANFVGTSSTVEVTWIAWLFNYGLMGTLAATGITIFILCSFLKKTGPRSHWYVAIFFLLIITGSHGLATKTLLLTWLVCILGVTGDQPGIVTAERKAALIPP